MFDLKAFLTEAVPPKDSASSWFEAATNGVDLLIENIRSPEVILFTNAGQAYAHAILAPLQNVTPPDLDELRNATFSPGSTWVLEHSSGGGEPDRMYLSAPIRDYDCKSLRGGEQLVFRRQFIGVDKGSPRTELSQSMIQALNLYWLDEHEAFCRLDEDGDIEQVIRVRDLSASTGNVSDVLVTIKAEHLHRYMAVTETALVMRFDFTRFKSGGLTSGADLSREDVCRNDVSYHAGKQADASFANGIIITRPLITKQELIAKANREWDPDKKDYATFKAYDFKSCRNVATSCAPSATASYFEKDSPLPYQTTPAFFRAEVLLKYKADPDKYRLEHRSINARGGWYLKSYDLNAAGQVHVYLCDLALLPYREQLYWQSFNEWPKASISERAFQTDFEGNFSTVADPLQSMKNEVAKLDESKPGWWSPRGEDAAHALHYPVTASPEEWSSAILALDQLIVEGFVEKEIRARLVYAGRAPDREWRSLRLLQEWLTITSADPHKVDEVLEPLRTTHTLRSKVKGHLVEQEKQSLMKQAIKEHGSLSQHFRALSERLHASFVEIKGKL